MELKLIQECVSVLSYHVTFGDIVGSGKTIDQPGWSNEVSIKSNVDAVLLRFEKPHRIYKALCPSRLMG